MGERGRMDSPTAGVFLPWREGLPSEEVGSGRPGEGDLFCLCSSPTILLLDSTETTAGLMHPWAQHGLLTPGTASSSQAEVME